MEGGRVLSWIKLAIHPEHEKVLRIADLTGSSPDTAFIAAVRWFRWVDAHVESAHTGISTLSFRAVARWADDGLSRAMLHSDVDWLVKGSDGLLRPTRPESHFSASAKKRGIHSKQVAHKRAQGGAQNLPQTRPDQMERQIHRSEPERVLSAPASVGSSVPDPEIERMVRALGLNPLTESRVLTLTDLTGREINEVFASVKATPGIKSIPAVVATELLRRRGIELGKKAAGSLSIASMTTQIDVSGLESIRRNRSKA